MKNTFRRTKMKTQQIQSYWVQVRQYFVAQNVSIKKKETSQGIQKLNATLENIHIMEKK